MREEDVPIEIAGRPCPDFGDPAWVEPPARHARRVAIVSTAGLIQRGTVRLATDRQTTESSIAVILGIC